MKFLKNHFESIIIAFLIVLIGLICLDLTRPRPSISYSKTLLDNKNVHAISIALPEADFEQILENAIYKTRYHADIKIDGVELKDVSFSTRGNGSLSYAISSRSAKFPYKVSFGAYEKSQTYYGLDKLVLNSLYGDQTRLREYLAFRIMEEAGVESPLTSFAELKINGRSQGLYLAVEQIDDSFLGRYDNPPDTILFKPKSSGIDHGALAYKRERLFDGEDMLDVGDTTEMSYDFEGTDLVYRGESPELYPGIFENATKKVSPASVSYIISAIKALSFEENIEDYWDIDELARYFAAHNFTVNIDSYTGITAQNYFLKLSNGKLSLLPWDYGLGFQDPGSATYSIDEPLIQTTSDQRPLWKALSENKEFMEEYHSTLQNLLDNYFLNSRCEDEIDFVSYLILPYVEKEVSYDEQSLDGYKESVEALKSFVNTRAESIQKQLWEI